MAVKKASFNIDSDLLKQLKFQAIEMQTTQTELLTEFLKEGLKKGLSKSKIKAMKLPKAREIQMPFTDSKKEGSLKNIIGIVEVDNAEDINVNELIDSIHIKKELY